MCTKIYLAYLKGRGNLGYFNMEDKFRLVPKKIGFEDRESAHLVEGRVMWYDVNATMNIPVS
jgi:hypothetical protein